MAERKSKIKRDSDSSTERKRVSVSHTLQTVQSHLKRNFLGNPKPVT